MTETDSDPLQHAPGGMILYSLYLQVRHFLPQNRGVKENCTRTAKERHPMSLPLHVGPSALNPKPPTLTRLEDAPPPPNPRAPSDAAWTDAHRTYFDSLLYAYPGTRPLRWYRTQPCEAAARGRDCRHDAHGACYDAHSAEELMWFRGHLFCELGKDCDGRGDVPVSGGDGELNLRTCWYRHWLPFYGGVDDQGTPTAFLGGEMAGWMRGMYWDDGERKNEGV